MSVRKLTLEEWFLMHQLEAVKRRNFHLPGRMDIDVTPLVMAWEAKGLTPPTTAILCKALGMLLRRHPEVNRMVCRTPWGARMVEFDYVAVNLPVLIRHQERTHLSATVIRDPDRLSLLEITHLLREARERKLADLPIGKLFITNRNTVWNRLHLRLLHFFVYNFPRVYLKHGGGGISLSSLMHSPDPGVELRCPSYGPTALTVFACAVVRKEERHWLHLDIGFDHHALRGDQALGAVRTLGEILASNDPSPFLE